MLDNYPGAVYNTVQIFRANPELYSFINTTGASCGYGTLGGEVQCGKKGYTVCDDPCFGISFIHQSAPTSSYLRPFGVETVIELDH